MVSTARCGSVRVVSRHAVERPAFGRTWQRLNLDARPDRGRMHQRSTNRTSGCDSPWRLIEFCRGASHICSTACGLPCRRATSMPVRTARVRFQARCAEIRCGCTGCPWSECGRADAHWVGHSDPIFGGLPLEEFRDEVPAFFGYIGHLLRQFGEIGWGVSRLILPPQRGIPAELVPALFGHNRLCFMRSIFHVIIKCSDAPAWI